jgi:hypothetical protein
MDYQENLYLETNLQLYLWSREEKKPSGQFFSQFLLRDKEGKILKNHKMHKEIQNFIEYCKDRKKFALIQVWMGAGKTEQIISRVVQEIVENREKRIMIVCEADTPAKQRVKSIRAYLQTVTETFNIQITNKSEQVIKVARNSLSKDDTVVGVGVFSAITGARSDLVIFDDIETIDNTITNNKQEAVYNDVVFKWLPRLDKDSMVIVIGTKFSKNGTIAKLENDKRFNTLRIGIMDNLKTYHLEIYEDGEQTRSDTLEKWDYYPSSKFRIERDKNPLVFALAYQLKVKALEDRTRFSNIDNTKSDFEKYTAFIQKANDDKAYHEINSIDLSGVHRRGTVITKAVMNTKTREIFFYKANYYRISWTELRDKIVTENNSKTTWIIESNGLQAHLIPLIREKEQEINTRWNTNNRMKIIEHYTGKAKNDLDSGILAMDNLFSKGQIFFNMSNTGICEIVDEFYNYGNIKGYFDGLMTIWFTVFNRKKIKKKSNGKPDFYESINRRKKNKQNDFNHF